MELKDTIQGMTSDDYKERFKAEYQQVEIRVIKLHDMIERWDAGKLDFVPTCPRHILHGQLCAMYAYKDFLFERAQIEDIQL